MLVELLRYWTETLQVNYLWGWLQIILLLFWHIHPYEKVVSTVLEIMNCILMYSVVAKCKPLLIVWFETWCYFSVFLMVFKMGVGKTSRKRPFPVWLMVQKQNVIFFLFLAFFGPFWGPPAGFFSTAYASDYSNINHLPFDTWSLLMEAKWRKKAFFVM